MIKYTVYKITNTINQKVYIGAHKTEDINDGYMGSGLAIKRAIEKYGLEHFTKEILGVYDNPEEMFSVESILVNEDFIKSKDTYNIKLGGNGGFDYINENGLGFHNYKGYDTSNMLNSWLKIINVESYKQKHIDKCNEGRKKKSLELYGNETEIYSTFKGKKHTEETKEKLRGHERQNGEKNSQYGTIWIYSLEEKTSKKIKKEELPEYIDLGWLKGRKMKFV